MSAAAVTITSLDAAARIPQRLEAINVSRNFFAAYTGISAAELSRYFTGKKRLDNETSEKMEADLQDLEWAAGVFNGPLQLVQENPGRYRNFVKAAQEMKEIGELTRLLNAVHEAAENR
jgi:transcriptional regulator with XRE-family HTH domain